MVNKELTHRTKRHADTTYQVAIQQTLVEPHNVIVYDVKHKAVLNVTAKEKEASHEASVDLAKAHQKNHAANPRSHTTQRKTADCSLRIASASPKSTTTNRHSGYVQKYKLE